MRRALIALVVVLIVCSMSLAFLVGLPYFRFIQAHRDADRRFRQDCELFAPVLAADPAFQRLVPFDFPVNGYCLGGPVPTQADLDRLREHVARVFGEPRVGHILADVWVEPAAEPAAGPDPANR